MSLIHEVSDIFKYKVYPQRWQTIELNKIVKIQNGYAFKSSKFNCDYRGMPLIRIRDIKNSTSETFYDGEILKEYIVFEEDLLIGMDGDFNSNLWKGIPALLNQRVCRLLPNENIILKKLVYYGLPEFLNKINENTSSTTVKHLSSKSIGDIPFPLPPLTEQNRIVAKLDSLFAQLESIKNSMAKIPVLLKNFRQQVLTQAVTGKLTEEWRKGKELNLNYDLQIDEMHSKKLNPIKLRGKDFFENAQSLYELPNSWKWIRLYKLTTDNKNSICAGPFGTIFKAKDFKAEGIPIIFLKHVKKEGFNFNKPVFMDNTVYEKFHREYTVYGGELLVTKLGDPPGEATIFPKDFGIAMVTPDVMKASIDENIILTKFVSYFFNSNSTKEIISEISFGMTRLRIDLGMFKAMPVPTPSFEEQQEIVSRVESLFGKADAIEEKYKNLKAKIETLPQAILHKAFKGELTEQLESDGDARVLLEEIATLKSEGKSGKVIFKKYIQPGDEVLKIVAEERPSHPTLSPRDKKVQRKMLATHIINQSLDDQSFGKTKFEKLLHLVECHVLQRDLNQNYSVQAAGPYDGGFTKTFWDEVLKSKWFAIQQQGTLKRIVGGDSQSKSVKEYGYFSDEEKQKINDFIKTFDHTNYERPEIVSTLYAVWNNRIKRNEPIDDELLKEDFLNRDPGKAKYRDRLDRALEWMRDKGIVPNGWGKEIKRAKNKKN